MALSSDGSWTQQFQTTIFGSFSSSSNGVASPTSAFICPHSRQRRFSRRSGIGRKLATHKNEVCLLPKQLGEQAAKLQVRALWEREFMALVRAQVKAVDFKRNYGIAKRSYDLLPVRPCRLQVDNNDAQLLPESWMRNWRNRTFVQSMVSFVVAFFHENVLAQLDFLKTSGENTSLRVSCSCDGSLTLNNCRLHTFGSFSRHLQTVSCCQHPRPDTLTKAAMT